MKIYMKYRENKKRFNELQLQIYLDITMYICDNSLNRFYPLYYIL